MTDFDVKNYIETSQLILIEWLNTYFDGGTHFGKVFPDCDIFLVRKESTTSPLTKSIIKIQILPGGRTLTAKKRRSYKSGSEERIANRKELHLALFVITDSGLGGLETLNQMSGLLEYIFLRDQIGLGSKGLHNVSISPPIVMATEDTNLFSYRYEVVMEVDIYYPL